MLHGGMTSSIQESCKLGISKQMVSRRHQTHTWFMVHCEHHSSSQQCLRSPAQPLSRSAMPMSYVCNHVYKSHAACGTHPLVLPNWQGVHKRLCLTTKSMSEPQCRAVESTCILHMFQRGTVYPEAVLWKGQHRTRMPVLPYLRPAAAQQLSTSEYMLQATQMLSIWQ